METLKGTIDLADDFIDFIVGLVNWNFFLGPWIVLEYDEILQF